MVGWALKESSINQSAVSKAVILTPGRLGCDEENKKVQRRCI